MSSAETSSAFEPGFEEALGSLRKLRRKGERHNDLNGPMAICSKEVRILVAVALSTLDRDFDSKTARAQLLEHFRYE
jgi:hypothetical protein